MFKNIVISIVLINAKQKENENGPEKRIGREVQLFKFK